MLSRPKRSQLVPVQLDLPACRNERSFASANKGCTEPIRRLALGRCDGDGAGPVSFAIRLPMGSTRRHLPTGPTPLAIAPAGDTNTSDMSWLADRHGYNRRPQPLLPATCRHLQLPLRLTQTLVLLRAAPVGQLFYAQLTRRRTHLDHPGTSAPRREQRPWTRCNWIWTPTEVTHRWPALSATTAIASLSRSTSR